MNNSDHVPDIKDLSAPATIVAHRSLSDGWWAPDKLYQTVLTLLREIIPAMQPGVHYTLQDLCGKEYWGRLSPGDKRTAGRCVPDMLARGLLPEIEIAEAKRTRRLRYRLKQ